MPRSRRSLRSGRAATERLYKGLDELFVWDRPEYEVFDPELGLPRLLASIDRLRHWLIGTQEPLPELESQLRGRSQTRLGVEFYVYASDAPTRRTARRVKTEPVPIRRLSRGDALTGSPRLIQLSPPQFNALRSQYLNPTITPADADVCYGLMLGDVLVGAFALTLNSPFSRMRNGSEQAYLISDFPVAPTDERRLSKLIVMAILSREVKQLAERACNRRIRVIVTTAFSDRPVSMKYRGLLTLTGRKDAKQAKHGRRLLNYAGDAGRWSLEEGYELWLSKYRDSTSGSSASDSATSGSSRSMPATCGTRRSRSSSRTSAATGA
jgi:hypothetical protein